MPLFKKGTKARIRSILAVVAVLAIVFLILPPYIVGAYSPPTSGTATMTLIPLSPPGTLGSYIDVTFDKFPDPVTHRYKGWCLDSSIVIQTTVPNSVTLYDYFSYNLTGNLSALPAYDKPPHILMNEIAYVLNHKQGDYRDVQNALWNLSDPFTIPNPPNYPITDNYTDMVHDARLYGGTFVPGPGQVKPILCDPGDSNQDAIPDKQLVIYEYLIEVTTSLNSPTTNGGLGSWNVTDTATVTPSDATGTITFEVSTNGTEGPFTQFSTNMTLPGHSLDQVTSDPYTPADTFWTSYGTAGYSPTRNTFDSSNHTVYMRGSGFSSGNYSVAYYDGGGTKVHTESPLSPVSGVLTPPVLDLSTYTSATAGTWHCVSYNATFIPPDTYIPNDSNAAIGDIYFRAYYHDGNYTDSYSADGAEPLHRDAAFTVQSDALPEFPTPLAGIGVLGACGGIYWWRRKRRQGQASGKA